MQDAALLVIDVQKAFDDPAWGPRNNPNAEANIASLLEYWRSKQRPVIHVHHSAEVLASRFHPSRVGHDAKAEGQPLAGEPIFKKLVNSAFIGTQLEQHLRDQQIENLLVVGLTTDHCVSTSVRMAANLGFQVSLVSDATATFDRMLDGIEYTAAQIQTVHLASLNDEFCQLITTAAILTSD
ncbi:cysteine hydrolase family protein [Thalassotalea sp. ND16A]|uniref:cysteine hydrolase family protein n=1 Tax=Thalassotalea sp. ND16A TaxID=1535422 RepID=UPI00051A591F|nr:cysteine hydrolase family protein [Thalassotalea sp. ND16A]KGJ95857.1 hypothetical protein ND16A_1392 [Thalassotalea sp. ND16A]